MFAVSNWRKLFNFQEALVTKRSVRLEVQLIVLMMNGKESSSLYRLAHDSKRLFILGSNLRSFNEEKKASSRSQVAQLPDLSGIRTR